jgi:hypothetical protein
MRLLELLNKVLGLMESTSEVNFAMHPKAWANKNSMIFISQKNIKEFHSIIEKIYSVNEKIYTKFTQYKQ